MMPWRTLCTAKHLQLHRCCCFSPSKQCRTHPFESIDEEKRRNCVYAIGRDREETRNRCATQSFRYLRVFFFFSKRTRARINVPRIHSARTRTLEIRVDVIEVQCFCFGDVDGGGAFWLQLRISVLFPRFSLDLSSPTSMMKLLLVRMRSEVGGARRQPHHFRNGARSLARPPHPKLSLSLSLSLSRWSG